MPDAFHFGLLFFLWVLQLTASAFRAQRERERWFHDGYRLALRRASSRLVDNKAWWAIRELLVEAISDPPSHDDYEEEVGL